MDTSWNRFEVPWYWLLNLDNLVNMMEKIVVDPYKYNTDSMLKDLKECQDANI